MIWRRQENKDLFWAGFLTGAVVGGTLGVLILSGFGQQTRKRLELAAEQVRSRFNGRPEPGEPKEKTSEQNARAAETPDAQEDVEEPMP